jgi:hypothetical protein
MYQVPEEWQKLLQRDLKMSKNWGTEGMNAEEARYNAMTPAQKAAENNRRRANNEARRALGSAPATAAVNTRRAQPAAAKAPKGKVMRECTASNVMHNVTLKNGSKAPCKFVHKNENAFSMLRPEQRKAEGGKTRRSSKRSSSKRRSSRSRRGGSVPNSPKPLSNVNTYTSWSGGIDPTVPLYNMKTML